MTIIDVTQIPVYGAGREPVGDGNDECVATELKVFYVSYDGGYIVYFLGYRCQNFGLSYCRRYLAYFFSFLLF